ncbi:transmembrane protein 256 homolog [Rhynchophorus ferrugineus]|uniref:transmembrane protein 256 homolog n=1 Tax=Rhynchophorus ferrugineus TaxID=354439 RepID=UPI003FCEAF95
MGFNDWVNYVAFDNPISKTVSSAILKPKKLPTSSNITVITEKTPLWKLVNECGPFIRIGALMGASAVALGAYGSHRTYPKDSMTELKPVFEIANRYHFFHSLALMTVPLCRNPKLAGTLFISGTVLFSGTLYYKAFTGDDKFQKIAPIGGTILILAWLSMVV